MFRATFPVGCPSSDDRKKEYKHISNATEELFLSWYFYWSKEKLHTFLIKNYWEIFVEYTLKNLFFVLNGLTNFACSALK